MSQELPPELFPIFVETLKIFNQASAKIASELCEFLREWYPDIAIDVGEFPTQDTLPQLFAKLELLFGKLYPSINLAPASKLPCWNVGGWPVTVSNVSLFEARSILGGRLRIGDVPEDFKTNFMESYRVRVEEIRAWLEALCQQCMPKLKDSDLRICSAIGKGKMTGEEIADLIRRPCNSSFKTRLSKLVAQGILLNERPGYRNAYPWLVFQSPHSQD